MKKTIVMIFTILSVSFIDCWVFQPNSECDTEPFISQPGLRSAENYRAYQAYKLFKKK